MNGWELLSLVLGLLLLHTYLFYPISLKMLRDLLSMVGIRAAGERGLPRQLGVANARGAEGKQGAAGTQNSAHDPSDDLPGITLVIAAFNEEQVLPEKIRNCLELDYPKEKLEILIGSDGSSDRTPEILAQHAAEVNGVAFPINRGKAAVLNDLVARARHDLLVFCDANTLLLPNALQVLARPFRDSRVGSACGRLILKDSGRTVLGEGESLYWNLETSLKQLEGWLGVVMGANGALYAMRRACYGKLPVGRTVMDDFHTTVEALRRGYNSIYLPTALGVESTSRATFGEFQRKVRIGRANFNFLPRYLLLLAPWRPLVAYGFASHKLLRWVAPWLSLALLGSALGGTIAGTLQISGTAANGVHLWPSALLLAAQLLFHGVAWRGHRANLSGQRMTWTTPAYYLDAMNLALLLGSLQALKPTRGGGWERIAREGDEK